MEGRYKMNNSYYIAYAEIIKHYADRINQADNDFMKGEISVNDWVELRSLLVQEQIERIDSLNMEG